MTAASTLAGLFALVYTIAAFLVCLGVAVIARFAWEILRTYWRAER